MRITMLVPPSVYSSRIAAIIVYLIFVSTILDTTCLALSSPCSIKTARGSRNLVSPPVAVKNGNQFAAALSDSNVDVLWIAAAVVDVTNEGWTLPEPMDLTRNVTIMGEPSFVNYPTLRLNYIQEKIRLSHGLAITFKNIVLEGVRRDVLARAPGFDLIAPALPGGSADLILEDSAGVVPACLPRSYRLTNHAGMRRPDGYPPDVQLYSNLNQTGCMNDTAAPALKRCWPDAVYYMDFVLYGADVNDAGSPVSNNMNIVLRNTIIACESLVDTACIERLTPVGCLLAATRNATVAAGVGVTAAGGAGGSGGRGSVNTTLVVALVVGVVGGLLVVLAALLVFRRGACRPRRRSGSSECDFAEFVGSQVAAVGLAVAAGTAPPSTCTNSGGPMAASKSGGLPGRKLSDPEAVVVATRASTGSLPGGEGTRGGMQSSETETRNLSDDCGEMLVTPLTPHREDLQLGVYLQTQATLMGPMAAGPLTPGGGAAAADSSSTAAGQQHRQSPPAVVTLLSVTRGKGAFGRVMEGMYCGRKVAVKVVEGWRPQHPLQASMGAAAQNSPQPLMQPDPEHPQHAGDYPPLATEAGLADGYAAAGPHFDAAFLSDALVKAFAHEVEVLGRCEHPNVVRLLAVCATPPRMCLVMELMETSLDKLMYGNSLCGNKLPLPKVLHIATCVCRALAYLHPTVVHRDLKPGNVLISNPGSNTPAVKLGDFGLSRLRVTVAPTTSPEAGTPPYMAPECFDVNNHTITHKADMFSLGVLLWEMLAGARPWVGCNIVAVAVQVSMLGKRLPLTAIPASRCSARLQQIMNSCWDEDPVRRPAAAEVANELAEILEACNRHGGADDPTYGYSQGTFRSFEAESLAYTSEEGVEGRPGAGGPGLGMMLPYLPA